MKKNNIKEEMNLKVIFLFIPFILGIIGFKLERNEYSYLDAAYASMQMYFANIPLDWEYNIYIELGRWMAPVCAVFLGIDLIMGVVRGLVWPRFWAKLPSHYVVYGDSAWTNMLCGENRNLFSKYCVLDEGTFIDCSKYILLFNSDRENFEFYTGFLLPHIKNKKTRIYMNVQELEPQDIQVKNLTTFQINDFIAISFFKNSEWVNFEKKLIEQKSGQALKIGIIGFGDLGKRMFQTALVMNIISERQKIEYHVWGNVQSYSRKHSGLSEQNMKPDKVIFHEEAVEGFFDFLENFDVVFLCGQQDENLRILSDLLRLTAFVGKGGRVYSYVENENVLRMFQVVHTGVKRRKQETEQTFLLKKRLFPISIPEKEKFLERVISDDLSVYRRAEEKHRAYIADAEKREEQKGEYDYFNWDELNSYLRWDNVSSANYDDVKILLREKGVPQEQLAEFEHIRWLRSHYLDNWKYSDQKDDSAHFHPDLQNFEALQREIKKKDDNLI